MFRAFTNQQLGLVLVVLAAMYMGAVMLNSRNANTFQKSLSSIDTSQVSRVLITREAGQPPLQLQRSGDGWTVDLEHGGQAKAAKSSVEAAIGSLASLQAQQLVSQDEDKWSQYQVDSSGILVELFSGEESLLEVVLGRFEYKQSGPANYVRLADQADTYLVDGFLNITFDKDVNAWRDKTLSRANRDDWSLISFNYPADSSFQLVKGADNTWQFPDSTEVDANKMNTYLNTLTNLQGTAFVEQAPPGNALLMEVQATGSGSPLNLKAYQVGEDYVLSSNQNAGVYFEGETIWKRVFRGRSYFLPAGSK